MSIDSMEQRRDEDLPRLVPHLDDVVTEGIDIERYPDQDIIEAGQKVISAVDSALEKSVLMDPRHRSVMSAAAVQENSGHMLLDTYPGLGKTAITKALAHILGGKRTRFQGTEDLQTSDITGNVIYRDGEFVFIPGPIFGNVVLADEGNRAPVKQQSALIEPLEEHQVTINGETHLLPKPHLVVVTQNGEDIAQGTRPLVDGLRDRIAVSFAFKPFDSANMITAAKIGLEGIKTETVLREGDLSYVTAALGKVSMSDKIMERAANIIVAFRDPKLDKAIDPENSILSGARPLMQIARFASTLAIKHGRPEVKDSDIDEVAEYVLAHRVGLDTWRSSTTFPEIYQKVLERNPHTTK